MDCLFSLRSAVGSRGEGLCLYPITKRPRYLNTATVQKDDLKSNLMRRIEAFKEEIRKSLKEIQETTIKHMKEMNKTVQDPGMKIEAIKKTQTVEILEMKNLGKRTGTTDTSIVNIIKEKEERRRHRRYN
jgi:predicted phage gp36 major capsid-like protein